jgi:hypothetical protein
VTELVPATLDAGEVIALIEASHDAIMRASTVGEARKVLAMVSTIEDATRHLNMSGEIIAEASANRIVSERRLGQLLATNPKDKGGRPSLKPLTSGEGFPSLAEQGVTYRQSVESQKLAAIPDGAFSSALTKVKEAVSKRKGGVTATAVLREVNPEREKRPDEAWLEIDRFIVKCEKMADQAPAVIAAIRFGRYPGDEPEGVRADAARNVARLYESLGEVLGVLRRQK